MRVVTFYSYKGGVGRTLACANFGLYLAKTGQQVILADMDFEAPGLDSKFSSYTKISFSEGILDQATAFCAGTALPPLRPLEIPLSEEVTATGGKLQLLPAGNYSKADTYHRALSSLNWHALLETPSGLSFWFDLLDRIEQDLSADFLVIDSRTGLTEIGGLCTQILPDTVLLFTSTSPESMDGTKRIYERILRSPIVKSRARRPQKVDVRVIVTRIPRPADVRALGKVLRERLAISTKLYYLFAEPELSVDEYLAMSRFVGEHPSILDDYVELFASLNPEATLPYIEGRLENFRAALTKRSPAENERIVQELLTLFPCSPVYLEAARYYRLAKGGDLGALTNYTRYLEDHPNDEGVMQEFAELCTAAPDVAVTNSKAMHLLRSLGPSRMSAAVASVFVRLTSDQEDLRGVADEIAKDPEKLNSSDFRLVYFRALRKIEDWKGIAGSLTEEDIREGGAIARIGAFAFAHLHDAEKTFQVLARINVRAESDMAFLFDVLFHLRESVPKETLRAFMDRITPVPIRLMSVESAGVRREVRAWIRDMYGMPGRISFGQKPS